MTPERWRQVKDILQAAMDRAPGERAAFLESCGQDTALRHEVESLLASHDPMGSFLEIPAAVAAVVPPQRGARGADSRRTAKVGRLLLAVEVLSPSTEHTDRGRKRTLYKEKAVPEYWIVDTDQRTIERRRPDDSPAEMLTESLEWQPDLNVPSLVVDVAGYFDRAHGLGLTR